MATPSTKLSQLGRVWTVAASSRRGRRVAALHADGDAHHPPPEECFGARSGSIDHAGRHHAHDKGRLELQKPVPAVDGVDVVEVEAEGLHGHPYLVGAR